jgi:hypothetical protein
MKQTAVEWLREKLFKDFGFAFSDNIMQEAMEMEKDEISKAYDAGYTDACSNHINDSENYAHDRTSKA